MNEHESVRRKTIDDIVDHAFAAEKDGPFVGLEWPQAGIGIFWPNSEKVVRRRGRVGSHGIAVACGRAWPSHEWNLPRQSSWPRSKRSMPNPERSTGKP